MGTTSTAILKTDSIMASKRSYAKVACQQVLKDQDIILPHRPGKFVLVFFHSSMKSRLLVDSVGILDPDGVLVKFSRSVTSCRWNNKSTSSALGLHAKQFTARVGLPQSERSCIFAVYYKARRVYIAAPLRFNADSSSVILPDDTGFTASRILEIQQSAPTFPGASFLPTSGPEPTLRESIDAGRVIEEDPRNSPKLYQDTTPSASGTASHASNPHLQSIAGSETPTQAFLLAGQDHYQPSQGSPSEMSRTSSPENYTASGSPTSDNLDLTLYQSGSSSSAGWGVISTSSDGLQNVFASGNVQMLSGNCSIMAPSEDHQDETSTSFAITSDDEQSNPQLEVPDIQRHTQSPNPDYAEWLRAITENSEDDVFNNFRLGGAQASLSTESVKNEFDFDFSMDISNSHSFDDRI